MHLIELSDLDVLALKEALRDSIDKHQRAADEIDAAATRHMIELDKAANIRALHDSIAKSV